MSSDPVKLEESLFAVRVWRHSLLERLPRTNHLQLPQTNRYTSFQHTLFMNCTLYNHVVACGVFCNLNILQVRTRHRCTWHRVVFRASMAFRFTIHDVRQPFPRLTPATSRTAAAVTSVSPLLTTLTSRAPVPREWRLRKIGAPVTMERASSCFSRADSTCVASRLTRPTSPTSYFLFRT